MPNDPDKTIRIDASEIGGSRVLNQSNNVVQIERPPVSRLIFRGEAPREQFRIERMSDGNFALYATGDDGTTVGPITIERRYVPDLIAGLAHLLSGS